MALFQKQTFSSSAPAYTIGATKTILVIGLGNPGKKYDGSRHNVGAAVLDEFALRNEFPKWKRQLRSLVAVKDIGSVRVALVKPQTYMNLSGEAAQAAQRFFSVTNENTLVVYDELALEFGKLRTRVGGSDAGHNGVKSLIQHLGEDFVRLRIGVGSVAAEKVSAASFVLRKFSKEEQKSFPSILQEGNSIITEFTVGTLPPETRSVI